jgi:hypothetical protein
LGKYPGADNIRLLGSFITATQNDDDFKTLVAGRMDMLKMRLLNRTACSVDR